MAHERLVDLQLFVCIPCNISQLNNTPRCHSSLSLFHLRMRDFSSRSQRRWKVSFCSLHLLFSSQILTSPSWKTDLLQALHLEEPSHQCWPSPKTSKPLDKTPHLNLYDFLFWLVSNPSIRSYRCFCFRNFIQIIRELKRNGWSSHFKNGTSFPKQSPAPFLPAYTAACS